MNTQKKVLYNILNDKFNPLLKFIQYIGNYLQDCRLNYIKLSIFLGNGGSMLSFFYIIMKEILKAYEFRIFPTLEQQIQIDKTIGCARLIYNLALSDRINYYAANKKSLHNNYSEYLDRFPFLKEVEAQALSQSIQDLNAAYSKFFKEQNVGFPKFKSKHNDKQSYRSCQPCKKFIQGNKFKIAHLGLIRYDHHREIQEESIIKNYTIRKSKSGKYFISVLVYQEYQPLDSTGCIVGIDLGIKDLVITSDGKKYENIKTTSKFSQMLAREQRKLSKMKRRSNRYKKQKIKIAKIHKHIKNQGLDFIHKLSTDLANIYDYICVEDLNLRNTAQTLRLGKSTNDNGFGLFRSCLAHKLADRGKKLIKVSKWYASSKICHHCGSKNTELTLNDRTWFCKECGCLIERDYNAAQNILDEGLKQV